MADYAPCKAPVYGGRLTQTNTAVYGVHSIQHLSTPYTPIIEKIHRHTRFHSIHGVTWHSDAAVEFTRLYRQHSDTQWTFKDFESLWDAQKYGAVDPERWRTRNQTESRREANVAEGKKKKKKRVRIA